MGSRFATICRQFSTAAAESASDAELLSRFATARDEAAFAAIVRRHGPMVWSVSRNLLANAADADDVFQATFLALVRGAKSVRRPEALGAWLHGVAVRVAKQLRRSAARRTTREKTVANDEAAVPVADSRWGEVLAAVHEEVDRLPDGERTAFIVCCLEGVRQPDAAGQLGWKPGTLTVRLSRAKHRLLERLTLRGLSPAAATGALGLGAATGQAAVPGKLVETAVTYAANAGTVPASILKLSRGVTDMTIAKVKLLAATVLVAGGLAIGGGAGWFANADAQTPGAGKTAEPKPAPAPPGPPLGLGGPGSFDPRPDGGTTGHPPMGGSNRPAGHPPWEYQFIDIRGLGLDDLKKLLEKEGLSGWELAGIDLQEMQRGAPLKTAILKRHKTPARGSPNATGMMTPGGLSGLLGSGTGSVVPGLSDPSVTGGTRSSTPGLTGGGTPEVPGGRFNPMREAGLSGGGKPAEPKITLHTIPLQMSKAGSLAKVLKELIEIDEFKGEVTSAIAEEDSNTLVLKATDAGKKLVIELIARFEETAAQRKAEERRGGSAKP